MPALGAAGAALGTSITLWVMFLVLAGYALLLPEAKRFGIHAPLRGYYHLIGKLLLLGLPVALAVSFETTAFSGATVMAGWMGENSLAAYQLSVIVTSFSTCCPSASRPRPPSGSAMPLAAATGQASPGPAGSPSPWSWC
jgi:MATE family multidrug resistance protein